MEEGLMAYQLRIDELIQFVDAALFDDARSLRTKRHKHAEWKLAAGKMRTDRIDGTAFCDGIAEVVPQHIVFVQYIYQGLNRT
jgi:hypothetical protein